MKNLFSVDGKNIIVTGGSRGLGEMMTTGLLQNGAKVTITARKHAQLQEAQERLSQYGECTAICADLSTQEGIDHFLTEFRKENKELHVLINNAGASWGEPIDVFPESGWDKVMDLNVKSLFFLTQQLLPELKATASAETPARVINIGSVNGVSNPHLENYSYSASKAAVIHLSRHMAADLAEQHINVNCISPGFFPSSMTKGLIEQDKDGFAARAAIPRLGQPEDIAAAALYLSSAASRWVTGINLPVDGGLLAKT